MYNIANWSTDTTKNNPHSEHDSGSASQYFTLLLNKQTTNQPTKQQTNST